MSDAGSTFDPSTKAPTESLSATFVACLPAEQRAELAQDAALADVLQELLSKARTSAPQLDADRFLRFVARNLPAQIRKSPELATLRILDLLVVYGYGHEDPGATAIIEHQYLPQIERSLRSYALSDLDQAEIRQKLRQLLWASHVPQQGMAAYSGRGELLGWLRVTAIREAGHLVRSNRESIEVSEAEALASGNVAGNAELQFLKAQYREAFHKAFDAAMAALGSKDQNLLRYRYLDNLSLEQIATLFKVNRATVVRWLSQTRESLQKQTRKNLQQHSSLAGVNPDEILGLVWSQLEVSIRRHLGVKSE